MAEGVEEHRIFVGGLDDDITDWELENEFSRHGEVFNVSVNARRGYGFVSYYRKEEAQNAIEDMHDRYLGHKPLRVEWAFGWPRETSDDSEDESEENDYDTVYQQSVSGNSTVYFGGLSGISRDQLEHMFRPFGEIHDITCFDDNRNYAFICFTTKEAAARAICSVNNTVVDHELVTCSWARNPQCLLSTHLELSSTSTSSESSRSSSPIIQNNFDTVLSMTTPNNRTVYVGGLNSSVTEHCIRSAFSSYGEIEHVALFNEISDYGFVRFSTKVSAALAICACDDKLIINGGTVRCNWSFRQDDDPPDAVEAPTPSTSNTSSFSPAQSEAACCPTPVAGGDELKGAAMAKEKKIDLQCKICMDEQVGVVFLPCGHLASCARCAQRIWNCPMCRKRITGKVRTYLS